MKNRTLILCLALILGALSFVYAEKTFEIGFIAGAGFTFADIVAASGEPSGSIDEWVQFNWALRLQGFFSFAQKLKLGVEGGFQNLFWYIMPTPYRVVYVRPVNISAIFEVEFSDSIALQAGAGAYFYENSVAPGVFTAFRWELAVSEHIAVPLQLRIDVIFAAGITFPVSLGSGLEFRF